MEFLYVMMVFISRVGFGVNYYFRTNVEKWYDGLMSHPCIPDLPHTIEGRVEFLQTMEALFEFYRGADYPLRLSGFGSGERPVMQGGVMFSVFEDPKREPIGSVRTTEPLLDVFDIVDELRDRLRREGVMVGYIEGDDVTHVLTIRRPGIPEQTWEYGIIADDVQAILLFLTHDCTDIRRV